MHQIVLYFIARAELTRQFARGPSNGEYIPLYHPMRLWAQARTYGLIDSFMISVFRPPFSLLSRANVILPRFPFAPLALPRGSRGAIPRSRINGSSPSWPVFVTSSLSRRPRGNMFSASTRPIAYLTRVSVVRGFIQFIIPLISLIGDREIIIRMMAIIFF
jgi:hypothetical protein